VSTFFQHAPLGWRQVPLKFLIQGSKNGAWGGEAGTDNVDAVCVRVADFDWQRLRLDLSNPTIRSFGSDQFRRLKLEEGDILLEKSGGGEKTPVGRVVMFSGNERSVTSNFVARVRPTSAVRPRFLLYLLAAQYISGFSFQFVKQNTGIQNLDDAALLRSNVWVPDHDMQQAITDFLDRETSYIDHLIEKKALFNTLLKEKRAAIIDRAVTQGIDPDVPLKDSGLDWIAKIPIHWQIVPPTVLFTESKERAREGDQLLSATQRYGVIPLAEFEELEQRQVTLAVSNLEKRKHVEIGDFVISMRSMDGGLERARAIGSVRSSYSVLKPGPNVVGRFYGALLKSSLYIQALRLTSNFIRDGQDMNLSHFRQVWLPKLDVSEQMAIANHIEGETSRIDSLITLTGRSIDRLREYRASLITAAVTGQIDVSSWRKHSTTDKWAKESQEALRA